MRHQIKKKYSDQQEIDRKDYSQNEYRRTQKYKTGWRARWGKFKDRLVKILRICFLFMVPIVTIYLRCFYDGISENSIYGLWQSENHKHISYNEGGKVVSTIGKLYKMENRIKNARTQKIKGLKDGTIYIEVYAKESLFSDLPTKNGHNYLNMYVRKDHYLTYNGESYKRIDDRDKTITWKDGSTSVYGERKTFFDYIEPFLSWGMMGALVMYCHLLEKHKAKSEKKSP